MKALRNFIKGMIAGVGGIAPGLSGSVLMVLLGVYERTIHALGTLLKDFKKNMYFLIPLLLGMVCGVLLFSKVVDYLLHHFQFQIRYTFLGLVIGTIPLFYKQVGKQGFHNKYYWVMLCSIVAGFLLFGLNDHLFAPVRDPNFFQSLLMGVTVAASSIVPGIDSAVILSTLGFYEMYVGALADFDLTILLPAALGLLMGAIAISALMNMLLKKAYTITFSILFGLFISIIPNMLNESCAISSPTQAVVAALFAGSGCLISYYLGDVRGNNRKIKAMFAKRE